MVQWYVQAIVASKECYDSQIIDSCILKASHLPLPLIVMGVIEDALDVRAPAKTVLALHTSARGAYICSPFIVGDYP